MIRSLLARLPEGRPSGNECPARTPLGLWVLFASLLFLAAVLAIPGRAESAGPAEELGSPADPPARVGRLAFVDGVVSFRAAGQDQWSAATLNYPVTSGDAVWTEPEAHAVVEIGPAVIRMGGATEFDAAQIDLHVAQLQLAQGSANIRLAVLPPGDSYVVATPRGAITLLEPGLYRVDAGSADQPTRIAAFQGAAAFAGGGSSLSVEPGQAVEISGQDTLGYAVHPAAEDDLDRWAAAQDEPPELAQAAPAQGATVQPVPGQTNQYVSPEATGYRDLDHFGTWANTPDYGAVWYPTAVPQDWVPYRYGHWAWVAPWGWTWIDDAPWGFTPFHYGRWVFIGDRWAWVPGELVAEPVYAPALVTFIGGPDWSVEVAEGPIAAFGWIPLAPEEIFVPFFHCSPTFIHEVNITNVNEVVINEFINKNVIVNNTVGIKQVNPIGGVPARPIPPTVEAHGVPNFANGQTAWANQHAVTVVAHKDFVSGRPVAAAALSVTPAVLKTAHVATARGPGSLPQPVAANAAPTRPAPKPPVTAQLRSGAPAFHGSAPAQAAQHESGHALPAPAPEKAHAQSGLPNLGAPAPRAIRGDAMTSAPGPHPIPTGVPARPIPPTLEAHGVPASAQPHSVQPVTQPRQAQSVPLPHPVQQFTQPHSVQQVAQPHQAQPVPLPHPVQQFTQPHSVQPIAQPHQAQPIPQPHPVQQFTQPHQVQRFTQPHSVQPVAQPHQAQPVPQPHPVQQFTQPHQVQRFTQPHPVEQVAQPHPAPQIASLPPGPRVAPPAVAPNRSVAAPPSRAAPQVAHVMPSAPAPQPHAVAPAARMAPPPSQGRPTPAQGHPSQQPHRGDQNN